MYLLHSRENPNFGNIFVKSQVLQRRISKRMSLRKLLHNFVARTLDLYSTPTHDRIALPIVQGALTRNHMPIRVITHCVTLAKVSFKLIFHAQSSSKQLCKNVYPPWPRENAHKSKSGDAFPMVDSIVGCHWQVSIRHGLSQKNIVSHGRYHGLYRVLGWNTNKTCSASANKYTALPGRGHVSYI